MRMEFPLLSIVSVCVLLLFGSLGSTDLYSIELGFSATSEDVRITIDPVFAIWVPQSIVYGIGCNAFAYANVMVLDETSRETQFGRYLLEHESNHIEQIRALGLLTWPAQFFIDIEPPKNVATDRADLTQPDRTMWLPPLPWVSQYHFITLVHSRSP